MADLPTYEADVLKWIEVAWDEGEGFLRAQRGYADIDKSIDYIQGKQDTGPNTRDMSNFASNRLGKISTDIVAALTDIKPIFAFKTLNDNFKEQGVILNKLAQSWWLNNFIDLKLGGAIQLAIPAGCAYLHMEWNPDLNGGLGDIDVTPLDPRDVVPVRPTNSISIQDSVGVIIRTEETTNYLQAKYPHLAERIRGDKDLSFHSPRTSMIGRAFGNVITPVQAALRKGAGRKKSKIPGKEVFTCYIKDDRKNEGQTTKKMGYGSNGETFSWSYDVPPGEKLYPRGRLIVASRDIIYYDGPNPYWHGMFPIVKLPMDLSFFYQDSYLSKSLIADLIPHQDVINEIINGIMDAVKQSIHRGIIADSRAIAHAELEKLNSRAAGFKLLVNPTAGEGVQWADAPNLPSFIFDFLQFMISETEYISGSRDLADLARVRQLPAADSVEAIMQAMTPATRLRGRIMEATLRELAELLKFNFFQFYDTKRRVGLLGPSGLAFEDFDFDPGNLIPDGDGMIDGQEQEGYAGLTRSKRAIKHARNFSFFVTPNSMLQIALVTEKAKYLQLRRMGEIDHETFLEKMEVPNIPDIDNKLKSEINQLIQMRAEIVSQPPGQKPSGQAPPKIEQRGQTTGGPVRGVVSESK